MTRVQAAVDALSASANDFFGGWEASDVATLERHARRCEAVPGKITDYFGMRTSVEFVPWAAQMAGSVFAEPPVPDDLFRAETIEYLAALEAIETAPPDRFVMAELGASYAPWSAFCGVVARRTGRLVDLTALEASSYFAGLIPRHARENDVEIRVMHGALASRRGTLLFPLVDCAASNGFQILAASRFSRVRRNYERVKAVTIADALDRPAYDFVHIDVQGAEADAVIASIGALNRKARRLFVGTHSRMIEGRLLDTLTHHGWKLIRERPCKFSQRDGDPVGWTIRDGGQHWINSRL